MAFIGISIHTNQIKAAEENQEGMKTENSSEKENEEEEAWKIQTVMNSATLKGKEAEKEEKAMWDCGSPLYDSHELASLNHLIERHLMAFTSLHGSKPIVTTFTHQAQEIDSMMAQTNGSTEKSKRSFMVTSLSKFFVRIRKRKVMKEAERRTMK